MRTSSHSNLAAERQKITLPILYIRAFRRTG